MKKKIISAVLSVLFFFGNNLTVVMAQEATESAGVVSTSPTLSPTPSQLTESNLTVTEISTPNYYPGLEQLFLQDNFLTGNASAVLRKGVRVRDLTKENYSTEESVTVVVENTITPDTEFKLYNVDGQEVGIEPEVVNNLNPTVVSLEFPRQGRVGRYRLEVTDPDGNTTTQDFTWGVLAINTNKSIYLPNETSKMAIAVLDETGNMVCDAGVELRIKNQESRIDTTLSTSDGSIIVNDECYIKDFTLVPDYETEFQVEGIGTYDMTLTATTNNGTYSINDSFEVRDSVAFDVERTTATRLFPPKTYPVTFDITFNQDFEGMIVEKVPSIFAIDPPTNDSLAYNDLSVASPSAILQPTSYNLPPLSLPFDGNYPITQTFGSPPDDPILAEKYTAYGVLGHDGVDFSMDEGTPILAVDDGEVIAIEGDYGKTVVIQHAWGRSYYGHLSEITTIVGSKRPKGHPIGMSGMTGLSTAPHLHLGIKPNESDTNNGYFGKINPLPYLGLVQTDESGTPYATGIPSESNSVSTLTWNVTAKSGDKLKLGYNFKSPNISPQFYLLGPLEFRNSSGALEFEELRQWQLAVDADGSGSARVDQRYSVVSRADQTYVFTYTATETLDSGGITITVPSGWSAPQATAGTAGRTVVTTTGNATIATVLNSADSITGWEEALGQTDPCNTANIAVDGTVKQEGTNSIKCNNDSSTLPDGGDGIAYTFASQNWSTLGYTQMSWWMRSDDGMTTAEMDVGTNETGAGANDCTTMIQTADIPSALTADTWVYQKLTLSGTITDVESICFLQVGNSADSDSYWVDEIMLGPGLPTFSGAGPWDINIRILDAASTETIIATYGSGGGTSGVDNPATAGDHTFTTKSRTLVTGSLTNIAGHPVITLINSLDDLMRHGKWFNSGAEQPFVF